MILGDVDWAGLLERNGWPTVLLVLLIIAAYRLALFFAPKISTLVEAHVEVLSKETEQGERQTALLESHGTILMEHGKLLSEHGQILREIRTEVMK